MRWPLVTLVGVCAGLWIDALTGGTLITGAAAVAIVAFASVVAGLRAAAMPLGAVGVVSIALLAVADQIAEPGRFALASDGVFYCIIVLTPALIGWLIAGRNRQVAQLRRRRRELETQRAVTVEVARAAERERVVRGLDLGLAERLAQVVADARAVAQVARSDTRRIPERLERIEDSARDALTELRDVLGTLRAPQRADVSEPFESAATIPMTVNVSSTRARARVDLLDAALVVASVPLAIETALPAHPGAAVLNVLAAVGQGCALTLVRRRPLSGLVVLLAFAVTQTAVLTPLPPTVSWLLPGLSAALLLGLTRSRTSALIGLPLLMAGVVVVSLATPTGHRATDGLVPGLVMGLLVWVGGRLVAATRTRAAELEVVTDELHRRQQDDVRLAVLQQRADIARDLHDAGAHALTVVCLQAAAARTWWQRDRVQALAAVDSLTSVVEDTVSSVGRSLGAYAHADKSDADESDGSDLRALTALVGVGRALGLEVDLGVTGSPRAVPADVVRVAYRIVQEGLTNAARYAAGSTVRVALAYRHDAVEVRILDTGASKAAVVTLTGTGAGLTGMRERIEAIRGELRAGPSGPGFEISARLPT